MINPHTSPWFKPPKDPYINDLALYRRWSAIKHHLTTYPRIHIVNTGILAINNHIYIGKNTSKMRIKSHLDWVWYTPKTLAQAIDLNQVDSYYEIMLKDVRSDPNIWKDRDFEMELKSYYAARAKRASLIGVDYE